MTTELVQRAYEVALHAAKAGERDRFAGALAKLQTLDRTGEITSAETLELAALGHTRCGDLKLAAVAVRKMGGPQTAAAQRVRALLLDMPEASISRYRECVDSLIPASVNAPAHQRRLWPMVGGIVVVLVLGAAATWTLWPSQDEVTATTIQPPATSWAPTLPPEVAQGTSPAAKDYRRMMGLVCKVILRAHVMLDGGQVVKVPVSTGSGFVASKDGLIITNKHVVEDGPTLRDRHTDVVGWDVVVLFPTGQPLRLDGRVEHLSAYIDLATIRVDRHFDEVLEFALTPAPGETVRAYGFPGVAEDVVELLNDADWKERVRSTAAKLKTGQEPDLFEWFGAKNLQLVLTSGIISAVRDTEQGLMLQTDTAVHGGNSGGPLLDSKGRVVGVVTLRASTVESANFCIAAKTISEELAREPGIKWPKFSKP